MVIVTNVFKFLVAMYSIKNKGFGQVAKIPKVLIRNSGCDSSILLTSNLVTAFFLFFSNKTWECWDIAEEPLG